MTAVTVMTAGMAWYMCVIITVLLASFTHAGELLEYCEDEAFKATCADNEAIIIDSAKYGRMRTGKCVNSAMRLGCSIDVVSQLDRRCSGRSNCEVMVTSLLHEGTKPCPIDFRSYLEASYSCMPVMQATQEGCFGNRPVKISASSGQISSLVTRQSGCGSIDNPWLLQAGSGQQLNFTLYDFSLYNRGPGLGDVASDSVCMVYAIIKENTGSETICGGRSRISHVFTSKTPTVEVRLVGSRKQTLDDAQFVLKFEAVGCADPERTPGGWMKREDQKAIIGCKDTEEQWTLTCDNGRWLGEKGSCPYDAGAETNASKSYRTPAIPNSMSIVIVVGIALVVGLGILLIGLFCLKRQRWRAGHHHYATADKVQTHPAPPPPGNKSDTHMEYFVSNSENDYYRTWQLQQRSRGAPVSPSGECMEHSHGPAPQTYRALSTDSSFSAQNNGRYSEHLYESPKFDHQEMQFPEVHMEGGHVKYFELDPETEMHLGRQVSREPNSNHIVPKTDASNVKIV